jgi:FkbM family methyltransferase
MENIKLIKKLDNIINLVKSSKIKKGITCPSLIFKSIFLKIFVHFLRYALILKTKTFWDDDIEITIPPYSSIWYYGAYVDFDPEIRLTKFLIRNLKRGDIFFDIGANIGYYSLLASKLIAENGKVFSFEPDPDILKILQKNKRDNITIVDKVISDVEGRVDFYSRKNIGEKAISTINLENFQSTSLSKIEYIKIKSESTTLDSFCFLNNIFPDFIKIDVEGAEEKVIKGAKKILEQKNPTIIMEVWLKPFTENYENAIKILQSYNFKIFEIKENGELSEIEDLNKYFLLFSKRHNIKENNSPIIFDNLVFKKLF